MYLNRRQRCVSPGISVLAQLCLQATFLHTPSSNNSIPSLTIQNSLTNNKDVIRPLHDNTLLWYSCGPTVYDHSHIGHARNYVSLDIITRIIRDYFGYEVVHVMGMTDVDDKIVKRSAETNTDPVALAERFEKDFFDDMRSLNVRLPTVVTRVTQVRPFGVSTGTSSSFRSIWTTL